MSLTQRGQEAADAAADMEHSVLAAASIDPKALRLGLQAIVREPSLRTSFLGEFVHFGPDLTVTTSFPFPDAPAYPLPLADFEPTAASSKSPRRRPARRLRVASRNVEDSQNMSKSRLCYHDGRRSLRLN